jgi:hypothetical protein
MGYWGMGLLPLVFLRSWVLPRGRTPRDTLRTGFVPPLGALEGLLRLQMRLETRLAATFPLGTSLMLVARKSKP